MKFLYTHIFWQVIENVLLFLINIIPTLIFLSHMLSSFIWLALDINEILKNFNLEKIWIH